MATTGVEPQAVTTALSARPVAAAPSGEMFARLGSDASVSAANEAFVAFFRVPPSRAEGKLADAVLIERIKPHLERAFDGERCSFLLPLVDPRGNLCQLRWLLTPERAADGSTTCAVTITDVTATVGDIDAVGRDAQLYRALARNTPGQFSLLFDHRLHFAFAEGPALSVFGHSAEDMEGRSLWEALPNVARELEPRYRAALKGETVRWMRPWFGRVLSVVAAPVRDERGVVFAGLVVGTDVTDRHRRDTSEDALRRIAEAVANRAPLSEVARIAAHGLLAIFNASSAGVVRFQDGAIERLVLAREAGSEYGTPVVDAISPGSAVEVVAAKGRACVVRYDERTDAAFLAAGLLSTAAAPIRVNGSLWGAVGVALPDLRSDEDEALEWLDDFCAAVTLAISNAAAWDELRRQAVTDELTGLGNRRAFNETFAAAVETTRAGGAPVGLVLVDVNEFKSINDRCGHPGGDEVLRALAERLASVVGRDDLVARIGGDEFAVLLAEGGAARTAAVARQLCAAVAERPIGGIEVSVSCGSASTEGQARSPEELMTAADRALYEAKNRR